MQNKLIYSYLATKSVYNPGGLYTPPGYKQKKNMAKYDKKGLLVVTRPRPARNGQTVAVTRAEEENKEKLYNDLCKFCGTYQARQLCARWYGAHEEVKKEVVSKEEKTRRTQILWLADDFEDLLRRVKRGEGEEDLKYYTDYLYGRCREKMSEYKITKQELKARGLDWNQLRGLYFRYCR